MQLGDVVVLALTQGLTEFLPVSSSGHLVIVRLFFGISDIEGTSFDAFLHLGTLCAVLIYYRSVWYGMMRSLFVRDEEGKDKQDLFVKIAVATVPGAVAGYFFQDSIEHYFRSPVMLSAGLVITALSLLFGDLMYRRSKTIRRAELKDAALIGLAQAVALIPSISRSGLTIAAGRWRGLDRVQAANFSFLMSAPIIAGAGLAGLSQLINNGNFLPRDFLVGFIVSLVAGLLSVHLLIKLVQKISFKPFAVYLLALSVALLFLA